MILRSIWHQTDLRVWRRDSFVKVFDSLPEIFVYSFTRRWIPLVRATAVKNIPRLFHRSIYTFVQVEISPRRVTQN